MKLGIPAMSSWVSDPEIADPMLLPKSEAIGIISLSDPGRSRVEDAINKSLAVKTAGLMYFSAEHWPMPETSALH